jgi:predicted DNA-binding ribbon-helix-helix protein
MLLEREFWSALEDLAKEKEQSVSALISEVDRQRQAPNLASALRLYVLSVYKERGRRAGKPPIW